MKTHVTNILKVIVLAVIPMKVYAETNSLNYSNRAYVHAIPNAPNPVDDIKVESPVIIYTDTAYGQAIYSYPNNNPIKFRLELGDNSEKEADKALVPTAGGEANLKHRQSI